jgi:hypothetical protein
MGPFSANQPANVIALFSQRLGIKNVKIKQSYQEGFGQPSLRVLISNRPFTAASISARS